MKALLLDGSNDNDQIGELVPMWMVVLIRSISWVVKAEKFGEVYSLWRKPFLD
jgi:hypothetical protein